MVKIARLDAWSALLFAATPASAGSVSGLVDKLWVRSSDGLHYVTIKGAVGGSPACATNPYFMIRDEKSDAGKSQFAMLMSAYLSAKPVTIIGTGTCTRWVDGEDILLVNYGN